MSLSGNVAALATRIATEIKSIRSYIDAQIATRAASAHTHGVTDLTATGTKSSTVYLRGDNTWATPTSSAPANMATTDTAQTVTGAKTFGVGKLLMTDGTTTSEPYSDVNAPQTLEMVQNGATAVTNPAAGKAVVYTTDGTQLLIKNPAGTVNTMSVAGHTHTASNISDSTATGRSLITAVDAATARSAIGAGTGSSNLVIGTTSTTAKAGDYQPTSANISDATATGRSLLVAADPLTARTAINAAQNINSTATNVGLVELATTAETTAMSDTVRAVTPNSLLTLLKPSSSAVTFNATNAAEFDTASYGTTRVWKTGNLVNIQGMINVKVAVAHTAGADVFTIPSGWRPVSSLIVPTILNQSATNRLGRLDISTTGLVRVTNDSGTNMVANFWVPVVACYQAA